MESQIAKKPKSQILITIEVKPDELQKFEKSVIDELVKEVKISGFRPGHAPVDKVREHLGEEAIKARIIDRALPKFYLQAIEDHKLRPVAQPKTSIKSLEPFKVEFLVDIYPEVKVAKLEKIKLKKNNLEVSKSDIESVMKELQDRFREYKIVERAVQDGDRVEVTFAGKIDGKVDERLKSKNHPVIIGSKVFVGDFESQLIGQAKNGKKEIKVKFPDDYRAAELRGKEAVFDTTIEQVEEVIVPKIDDQLAKKASGDDEMTLEKFTEQINHSLMHEKEAAEEARLDVELFSEIAKHTTVDLPESFIHEEVHFMLDDLEKSLVNQGLTLDSYLQIQKTDEEGMMKKLAPEAEKRLKVRLALYYLADERKVEISDEELDAALDTLKDTPGKKDENFKKNLRNQLRVKKTLDEIRISAIK